MSEIDDEFLTLRDTYDDVYGRSASLLPKFFVNLMALCLRSRALRTADSAEQFARQIQVARRLPWMRNSVKGSIQMLDWPTGEMYKNEAQWVADMLKV
jgi:hypothetical protein